MKNKPIEMVKQGGKWVAATTTALAFATTSFAVDHTAEIDAAYVDGNLNVTAAVVGLIALAAVVTGVSMIISMLKRG